MNKIVNHREKTEKDILRKLKKYGMCAEVRPCDFGKTYGAVKLAIENYNNILYLHPAQAIRDSAIGQICSYYGYGRDNGDKEYEEAKKTNQIGKFTFMTYMKLIRLSKEELAKFDYDLIIFDEMHKIGAEKTNQAIEHLKEVNNKAHLLGMTATPDRTDAIDVIERHFDNIIVYPYTLHDAFKDGLIQKPYYIYSTYNQVDQIKEEIVEEWKKKSWKTTASDIQLLDKKVVEIANLFNIPNIIKGVCTEAGETSYLKFICFFDNFKHLEDKSKDVLKWFKEAFPNHIVNSIVITSETEITKDNVNKLNSLKHIDNHIDLIFSVNMLNVGYHIDDLTGIVMYRCTNSNIVYIQQLGRALSGKKHGIILDVVNNIGRKALYDNYVRSEETPYKAVVKNQQILDGTYTDTYTVTTNSGEELEISKDYYYDKDTDQVVRKWHRNCNSLLKDDLLVTGVEATRKQIEKKVIAESFVQVAHKVLLNYFKLWCNEVVHIPFPISFKQMYEAYGYSREDFRTWFDSILKQEDISFPYHTLKKLTNGDKLFEEVCMAFSRTSRVNAEDICSYYN